MKLLKRLMLLAGVLFLFLAGYAYQQHHWKTFPFEKIIPQVDTWTLHHEATTLTFVHGANAWSVSEGSGSYTADSDRVKAALDNLQELGIEDEISDRADRAVDFQVDAASGIFVDLMKGSAHLAGAVLGKQAPDAAHLYFRLPQSPNVYLVQGVSLGSFLPATLKTWRSKVLWTLEGDPIVSILVETPVSRTYLLRSSDTWTCNGQQADKAVAEGLVNQLTSLRADEVADLPLAADITPDKLTVARIVVQTKSSAHELHVGAHDAKLQRVPAALANDSNVVWLYDYKATALFKKPSDFLPQPPQK